MEKQIRPTQKSKHFEQIVEKRFANYKLMLYFALLSITVLFLTLSVLYLFSSGYNVERKTPLVLHPAFFVNSFLLAVSSIGLYFTQQFYKLDDYHRYKIALGVSFGAGTAFIVGQTIAWYMQWDAGFHFNHSSAAYLYIISGLHGVHMFGGLVFMLSFFVKALQELKDFPTSIIYFTDPVSRFQLSNLSLYWHFMGGLWLYLMIFFLLAR
jgi:cytochrome c oxidase subunit III